jgi:sterol desaturase/sphingolipid hydroxylase (fatty acid hydroxylase superfamily)
MNRDVLLSLALLGWFVALAILEVVIDRDPRPPATPNADARFITNFGFTAIFLMAGASLPLANAAAAASSEGFRIGLANQVQIPWLPLLALTLMVQTFAGYWAHRWMHSWPLLWRFHRVHHADSAVDVSTSLRNHPLELLVTLPVSVVVTLAIGAPISVVTAGQTILVAATIWEHADISLPPKVDQALATFILTPRLHRLHHNPERAVHDSNFGTVFSFWDRLFGTLCVMEGRGKVGLDGRVTRPDHFVDQILLPLRAV